MIYLPAGFGMGDLNGFFVQSLPTCFNAHILNRLISEFLHMETVCDAACGGKTEAGDLLHVRSHIHGYLPDLKASAAGKTEQYGGHGLYICSFHNGDKTARTAFSLLVYQHGI